MSYLFGQIWVWLLISFLLGALVTWLVLRASHKPKVRVSEERFTGPELKAKEPKVKKRTAPARAQDSALGTLDDDERTQALRPGDEFIDETPTTRIPVQTETGAVSGTESGAEPVAASGAASGTESGTESGTLSGSLSDEAPTTALGVGAVGAVAASKDFGADSPTEPDAAAESADGGSSWSSEPPSSDSSEPLSAISADADAPAIEPFGAGSARPLAGGAAPSSEYTVKGNEDSMLYHTTDSPYYGRTIAEVWFKTPADAERAGFSPWNRQKAPQALVAPTWEAGAYANSAKPKADGSAPAPEFTVKGNVDSMLFHTEESAFYSVTIAEVWFRTAEDAEQAGFSPWNRVGGAERGETAVPQQAVALEVGPHGPNSAKPKADGSAPSGEYTVKGNADSMLFHTTDSPYYTRTKAEVWFKAAADAEKAGFTAWNRRRSEKSR
ncbi:LSU ribosomal protein L4p (L1e) [Alloactinosynnema sp. L-07]|uniref:LapA family protein n=1 Tax=Alloactinosynnema sp. L-07 TaxID=1653480 RepID=UPI00065EFAA6|nr:LapA family protein [Alloactinosynnema sp. L-07]CRK60111.1 LSU ribosomal protein L4p (L1e) [Alloactinosynnema sp. L-07]